MVRWIAFILFFLFILPAFADKKKKTENIQELDEKTRLEFDYSFMEGRILRQLSNHPIAA